ncbi:MAG: plasmid partitioning protein RepB [Shimia sp.]
MARKNVLNAGTTPPSPAPAAQANPRRGAVGALQSSLSRLQENAVQELDPTLIDDAGVVDRLDPDPTAQAALVDSLRTYGQQVPVLVRPKAETRGRYEIVYGRRRLAALKSLGQPVKAMVRHLDDEALVLAQGQENTARKDLSFIEKASFAAQLAEGGYERETIAAALTIDLPMVSRMLKVGQAFSLDELRAIGAAPGIGRDRWLAFVRQIEDPAARSRALTWLKRPGVSTLTSDARFEECVRLAASPKAKPPAPRPVTLRAPDGTALADMKATRKGLTLNIAQGEGFADWLAEEAEALIPELYDRWQSQRTNDQ